MSALPAGRRSIAALLATWRDAGLPIVDRLIVQTLPTHAPTPMRWIAIFTDTPEMLDVRKEREPLHLDYLRAHETEILIGGGCREAPGGPFVGGLWVLDVASQERAVELIENDPYFVPALRSYRLLTWGKALADKVVRL